MDREKLILLAEEELKIIFVQELKHSFDVIYKGKVVSYGRKGMYLCHNSDGFRWVETKENLLKYYRIISRVSEVCFIATTKVNRKVPGEPFSIKHGSTVIFTGDYNDIYISYISGVSYIFNGNSPKIAPITYLHADGSKEFSFSLYY